MAGDSRIEWTDMTWNPITGCTKISAGCLNCYAERMANRLYAMGNVRYKNKFEVTVHRDLFYEPLKWKRPKRVFVNSMSDLFHENVSDDDIKELFSVMNDAKMHTFQILTKRSERMREIAPILEWSDNIWAGVTVESEQYISRIDDLRTIPSSVRFISFEPLIGNIKALDLDGIDWAIVGGESGPQSRPMEPSWAREIQMACSEQKIPFFFKQWGGSNKKKNGRILDNRIWDEFPVNY